MSKPVIKIEFYIENSEEPSASTEKELILTEEDIINFIYAKEHLDDNQYVDPVNVYITKL